MGERKPLRVSGYDAYVQVVLQGLWSGFITGGEAEVVLEGRLLRLQLLHRFPRVAELASDGTEFL